MGDARDLRQYQLKDQDESDNVLHGRNHKSGKYSGSNRRYDKSEGSNGKTSGRGPSHNCGKYGHLARECTKPKLSYQDHQPQRQANQASFEDKSSSAYNEDQDDLYVSHDQSNEDHDQCSLKADTKEIWYVDSSASSSMTSSKDGMLNYEQLDLREIYLGNDAVISAHGQGDIRMFMHVNGKQDRTGKLIGVYFIPGLTKNLFSVSCAAKKGQRMEFSDESCTMWDKQGTQVGSAKLKGKLCQLICNRIETHV
jgi:hypothetical protein